MLWNYGCIERRKKISISLADLAAQRLTETCRCFAYFFCQEVLVLTAINIARGHFSYCNMCFVQSQVGSVIGEHRHAINRACAVAVKHDYLAATGWIVCVAQSFAVHAHITKRFFHHSVRLARNDKAIFGNAHIQTLTAATQCKQHRVRLVGTGSRDCYRTIKLADCLPKRAHQIGTGSIFASNNSRNYFRIGRNWFGNLEPITHFDIGMVINITVESGNQIRHCCICIKFFTVDWMCVCFRDNADTRPSCVPKHRQPCSGLTHQ